VAEHNRAFYLDLANKKWEAVEITETGWRVVADPPVKFCRPRGMLPLPYPVAGGSVKELRKFVNVASSEDWALLLAWVVKALRPKGPYPVLVLHGEQGSAKSTLTRLLKMLTDPSESPLRAEPRELRDLVIAAENSWCLALDNLSHLPPWLSDALCRLATGGGFATRELYTDKEEAIFNSQRPTILNGIEELATRADLLDRSMIFYLPEIPEEKRKTEEDFWAEFEQARPQILGALLDSVSTALRDHRHIKMNLLPRMADFAKWAVAAEPSLGLTPGTFWRAYAGNREASNDLALEGSPVAAVVRRVAEEEGKWSGTAQELLEKLGRGEEEKTTRSRSWPRSPRALSNTLRRLAPNLRAVGVRVEFSREGKKGRRIIAIRQEQVGKFASASSADGEMPRENGGLGVGAKADATDMADASASSAEKASEINGADATDATDAKNPPHSNDWQAGERGAPHDWGELE
jgi:hypothetical protein